jgi:hypothetical protein
VRRRRPVELPEAVAGELPAPEVAELERQVEQVEVPARPHHVRRRRPAELPEVVAGAPAVPEVAELQRQMAQLERRRQELYARLVTVSEQATKVETFQAMQRETAQFLTDVRALYPIEQFPGADDAMHLLENCIAVYTQERELTQRRTVALQNCRSSTRVLAESLVTRLQLPEAPPVPHRRQRARAEVREVRVREVPEVRELHEVTEVAKPAPRRRAKPAPKLAALGRANPSQP